MNKLLSFTALAAVLAVADAQAAGFHLREQSAAAQGNAFAGATAGAENNSYAYFNAAGLTRQKGTQLNAGGTYIAPEASAGNIRNTDTGAGGETGDVHNVVHSAVAPNGTVSHQLNDKVTLGLSLNVPFGMITKYNDNWAGSAHGNTSKVTTVTTTPMAAYKATDKLSLGVGLPVEYVRARLTSRAGGVYDTAAHGSTVDVGYQLGAMYEFDDKTRVGMGYRSEMKHKIKGKIESDMPSSYYNQDIHADLDLPAMFSVGAYHELNEKWAIMAEYQRVFWSSFDRLDFVGEDSTRPDQLYLSRTYENWRDANFYSIGASYQIDSQWKARFGLAYDEAAVKLAGRTPRIPDSNRIWYSVGLGYQYNANLSFDMAFTYIDAKDAVVDTANSKNSITTPNVYAEYSNSVKMWGLSLNYKF
jgi:long-chain fatty acid transport protein